MSFHLNSLEFTRVFTMGWTTIWTLWRSFRSFRRSEMPTKLFRVHLVHFDEMNCHLNSLGFIRLNCHMSSLGFMWVIPTGWTAIWTLWSSPGSFQRSELPFGLFGVHSNPCDKVNCHMKLWSLHGSLRRGELLYELFGIHPDHSDGVNCHLNSLEGYSVGVNYHLNSLDFIPESFRQGELPFELFGFHTRVISMRWTTIWTLWGLLGSLRLGELSYETLGFTWIFAKRWNAILNSLRFIRVIATEWTANSRVWLLFQSEGWDPDWG